MRGHFETNVWCGKREQSDRRRRPLSRGPLVPCSLPCLQIHGARERARSREGAPELALSPCSIPQREERGRARVRERKRKCEIAKRERKKLEGEQTRELSNSFSRNLQHSRAAFFSQRNSSRPPISPKPPSDHFRLQKRQVRPWFSLLRGEAGKDERAQREERETDELRANGSARSPFLLAFEDPLGPLSSRSLSSPELRCASPSLHDSDQKSMFSLHWNRRKGRASEPRHVLEESTPNDEPLRFPFHAAAVAIFRPLTRPPLPPDAPAPSFLPHLAIQTGHAGYCE